MDDDQNFNINQLIDKSNDDQNWMITESSDIQPNINRSLLDININTTALLIVDVMLQLQYSETTNSIGENYLVINEATKKILNAPFKDRISTFQLAQFEGNENPVWTMDLGGIPTNYHPHSFLFAIKGLKSFKIIQTVRRECKLIGYFEKWVDMHKALDKQLTWEEQILSWNQYTPPKQLTRSHGNDTKLPIRINELQEIRRLRKLN
ncbi:hypothetical protein RhiirC2_777052 [Rhizophagus irregularis]|uniref:Uncharacterized protein n=1 Tax=Rhizophagus irregularis TaxID=588596 RepID=A0A2N1NFG1_9GLOM|nr:hypothetical protein RhiirC2_777052 [Rhizophagus irregularis]